MPGRTRTTKKLAQRIDLNYFKRLYPFPRWRRILSIGLTGIAVLWLGWEGLAGKQRPYNAGPLAYSHALLTNHCERCHASESAFGKKVTDQACLACHDGPEHQAQQMFTPVCTDCHVEHQGSFRLAFTKDQSCTQCHSDLKTKNGKTTFAASISSFDSGHPEFAVLRSGARDPGTIRFGHQVHLKKDLRGPRGVVQLKCADCHVRTESPSGGMAPIDFQKHCAECHPLDFDQRFSEPVPHKKPEIVMDFVVQKFTQYIAAHPQEVHMADPADPRILRPPLPPARDAAEWISRRVSDTQQLLWRKTCKECHTLNVREGAALPEVAPAAIKTRWFTNAWFDHESHQMLVCTECHGRASTSKETSDVLLPGIQTCQQCHRSGREAAEARCFECHVYHDWTKEKKIDGKALIKQLAANRP
jgi:hypothetical protein